MAASTFDACGCAGKCVSSFFTTIEPNGTGVNAPGLVNHWAVTYDVQVRVLGAVLETGSASIADLIEVLPGHPAPVEAVMALVEAGSLVCEVGEVTPHTRVSLPPKNPVTETSQGGSPVSSPSAGPSTSGTNIVLLRSSVTHVKAIGLVPELFIVDIADRCDLPQEVEGQVIYCALSGKKAYTGRSGRGRERVLQSHLRGFKRLLVIRDAAGHMTERQAGIAERILGLIVAGLLGYELDHKLPHGAHGEFMEYLQLRLFVAQALCLAREAGFGFFDVSLLHLIMGAEGDPARSVSHGLDQVEGTTYHLYAVGINARATEHEGDWIIHPGSEVRSRTTRSGSSVVSSLRHEWLYSGVLVEDGGRFRLTEPVIFSSGSGAANFVLGSKGPNLSAWSCSQDSDQTGLSPAG